MAYGRQGCQGEVVCSVKLQSLLVVPGMAEQANQTITGELLPDGCSLFVVYLDVVLCGC